MNEGKTSANTSQHKQVQYEWNTQLDTHKINGSMMMQWNIYLSNT